MKVRITLLNGEKFLLDTSSPFKFSESIGSQGVKGDSYVSFNCNGIDNYLINDKVESVLFIND